MSTSKYYFRTQDKFVTICWKYMQWRASVEEAVMHVNVLLHLGHTARLRISVLCSLTSPGNWILSHATRIELMHASFTPRPLKTLASFPMLLLYISFLGLGSKSSRGFLGLKEWLSHMKSFGSWMILTSNSELDILWVRDEFILCTPLRFQDLVLVNLLILV